MYSIRLWTFVAALLLALSCGVVNVHAGRLGTSPGHGSSSIASADEKASRIYLRQLQSAPRTEEVTILKEGTARRGRSVAATATCPTGMTKSEVLECSRNNTKFTRRTEKDKVVDGHVVGSTCRFTNTKGRFFAREKTTVTIRVLCVDKPKPEPSPFPEGVFRMTTRFLEDEGFNLEGNRVCDTCTLGGAAFMSGDSRIPTGMQWKAKKLPNGFYHLTTVFQEPEGRVLEGNKFARSSFLGGAAFMSSDKGASGTMWKAIPAGGGYYFLTTKFLEDEDLVLEGNKVARGSTLGGAAFMSPDKATGTQWKFIEL